MMKKKFLIALLLAAVLTVAFAGCGQEESEKNNASSIEYELNRVRYFPGDKTYSDINDELSIPGTTAPPAETYGEPTQDIWLP